MEHIIITSMHCHLRFHTFFLSVALFGGYLQRATTRYRQIYKKMYINIFKKKLTVTRSNPLQAAPKPC